MSAEAFTGSRSGLSLPELIRRGRSWRMEFFYGSPAYYHAEGCDKSCGETCNPGDGLAVALDASEVWHTPEGRAEWRRLQAEMKAEKAEAGEGGDE